MHHEFPHQCLNLWKSLPRTQGLWYLQFGLAVGLTGGGGHASPCLSCLFLIWGNLLLCVTDIGWPLFLSSSTFPMCVNSVDLSTNPLTSLLLEFLSRPLNVYQILHQLCPTVLKFHFREVIFLPILFQRGLHSMRV